MKKPMARLTILTHPGDLVLLDMPGKHRELLQKVLQICAENHWRIVHYELVPPSTYIVRVEPLATGEKA